MVRAGVLSLARTTGWSLSEIGRLPVSEFLWWIEGLPRHEP